MIALYICLGGIALLLILYFFVLIRAHGKQPKSIALLRDYAHRGLWGEGVAENSPTAFALAAAAGFGIELDVQLSCDGEVMVFHDYTLTRMTGVDKKLSELTKEELSALRLGDSEEHIPTFREVLSLVGGRVPLLIELKGESLDTSLCEKVAACLADYGGEYCIESFNPLLLGKMRKFLPGAYYGLLYTNACRDKKKYSAVNVLVTLMALNFLARPNFIAYNKEDRKNILVRLSATLYRAPRFVWTVKGEEEMQEAHARGEHPIFEQSR